MISVLRSLSFFRLLLPWVLQLLRDQRLLLHRFLLRAMKQLFGCQLDLYLPHCHPHSLDPFDYQQLHTRNLAFEQIAVVWLELRVLPSSKFG